MQTQIFVEVREQRQSITFFKTLLSILGAVTHLIELVDLSGLVLLVASDLETPLRYLIV